MAMKISELYPKKEETGLTIQLTLHEWQLSAITGGFRYIDSRKKDSPVGKFAEDEKRWDIDIESACAERAYAKVSEQYYDSGIGTYKAPDVGNVQVRHTVLDYGKLILRDGDDPNEPYALMTGRAPNLTYRGWLLGVELKVEKYHANPHNKGWLWWAPQPDLHSGFPPPF